MKIYCGQAATWLGTISGITWIARMTLCSLAIGGLWAVAGANADESPAHTRRQVSQPESAAIQDALEMPIHMDSRRPGPTASGTGGPPSTTNRATSTVIGSLAVCLGAFLLFVWAMRRTVPRGLSPLPGEVVELLGRATLAARQQLQLIRVGKKLVLVSVSATGASTLTEITDDAEVERLAGLCQQTKPNSATAAFRDVLGQYAEEPATRGFVGERLPSDFELANRGGRRRTARGGTDHA